MASSVVDELFDRLISAFPADRAYGPDAFTTDPMPGPVAHFLRQLLQHRTTHELRQTRDPDTTWVDHSHPDVQRARAAYREALISHAQIPADEWEDALRRALQRVTAYLIHPTSTLTSFVYGDDAEALAPRNVQARMRFFDTYRYLHEAVNRYLEQHDNQPLAHERFAGLLERVDTRMTDDYEADDWLRLLQPLFTLMELVDGDQEVPTPFLHTFFAEKDAAPIARRLQTASVQQGTTSLSPADLRALIDGEAEPALSTSEPPSSVPSSTAAEPEPTPEPPADPLPDDDPDQPTPLWKQFRSGPSPSSPAAKPPEKEGDEAPLWQRFQPSSEEDDAPAEITALERDVLGERGPSNRALFIRKLFNGSEEDYKSTLQRLRTAPTWNRASQIIAEDVFRAHQVNIYSDPAVLFTNAVEDRFRNGQ